MERKRESLFHHPETNSQMLPLGTFIRRLRLLAGTTLDGLAIRASMPRSWRGYLSKLERGKVLEPRRKTLLHLEEVFYLPRGFLHRIPLGAIEDDKDRFPDAETLAHSIHQHFINANGAVKLEILEILAKFYRSQKLSIIDAESLHDLLSQVQPL